MICKDCMHKAVCENVFLKLSADVNGKCKHFMDKDLFIELPVPLGTVVYRLDWDYTDDEYSSKRVWFIDPVRFEIWHLDEWGDGVFETEEEALERLEEERQND